MQTRRSVRIESGNGTIRFIHDTANVLSIADAIAATHSGCTVWTGDECRVYAADGDTLTATVTLVLGAS